MKLKVKDMDIATGGTLIVIINEKDASMLDLRHGDRIWVIGGKKKTLAMLDIAESKKAVPQGRIGLFEEVLDALGAKHNDSVLIKYAKKPVSVSYIRKKLDGIELSYEEILAIIKDILSNKLSDIELTSYVTANYAYGMSDEEIVNLTKAMTATGAQLRIKKKPVVDMHSIGGVPGNRTTMVVVPILVAAGLTVPKTSSRAITSPAGTADTMEVLCPVRMTIPKLQKIIKDVGGFIIWGGSVNLAPADDKIIKIEHPMSIDAEGQMLASIMSKKKSVSTTHLLMEIPCGPGAKVADRKQAVHLTRHFERLGEELGIDINIMVTDGAHPIGRGIGPVLEAKDCLWILKNDRRGPDDLRQKSLEMAAIILEFVGAARPAKGMDKARKLLESGKAYEAMIKMIKAQGGKEVNPDKLKPEKFSFSYTSPKKGVLKCLDNTAIAKIARLAGAPIDKGAGIFLHHNCGDHVKKGEKIMTVYAKSTQKLEFAKDALKQYDGIVIQ